MNHGRPSIVPPPEAPPDVRQQFVDRVKNQARMVRFVQAVMAEVSPASPQQVVGNQKIPDEFRQMVTAEGIDKAYVDFAAKYPDAAPLIASMSTVTGGGVLAASNNAQNWIHANTGFVNANKDIASFFVPQTTGDTYSPAAYNEQIAMGLRGRKTPQQFQDDFYINSGWADYDVNRAAYEQALQAAGATQITPGVYSSAGQTQLSTAWNTWLTTFKAQNPTWAAMYDSPDTKINATLQLHQLRTVLADGTAPAGTQTDNLKYLVQQYDDYVNQLTPNAAGTLSPSSGANLTVTQAWEAWLKTTATAYPEYAPAVNKIFRWITPTTPTAQG